VSDATQPRGPYKSGIKRRQAIIESAVEVFGKHGFHAGYLRLIADKVGVTPAALLYHFPSKEELLIAALKHWDAQSDDLTGTEFSGLAFIDKQRTVVRRNATLRGLIELFASMSTEATNPDHPAHEFFVQRYDRVVRTFSHAFSTALAAGEVRADLSPETEARSIVALMDGLQIQWLLDPGVPMPEVFDACLESLLERISARSA
jgi:AcrR family transcriptional regulator